MQTSIVSTMLTLILLGFSLFGTLVPASPGEFPDIYFSTYDHSLLTDE